MANTKSLALVKASSQYVKIADGDQTGLDLTSDFSIECWVYGSSYTATPSARNVFVSKFDGTDGFLFGIFNNAGTLQLECFMVNSSSSSANRVNWTPSVDTWYHVAVTYNATTNKVNFYVDTSTQGSEQDSTVDIGAGGDFEIGAYQGAQDTFDGLIDDVRIWSDVRSGAEIAANDDVELDGDETGLISYWKFNDSLEDAQTAGNNDLVDGGNSFAYSATVPFVGTTDYTLAVTVGTFVLTGVAAALNKGYTLVTTVGAFTLTGVAAVITSARSMAVTVGAFTLTGVAATLTRAVKMSVTVGEFILSGVKIATQFWTKRTKPSTSWSNRSKPTTNYSNRTKPTTTWSKR
jgi:hypothetical protein